MHSTPSKLSSTNGSDWPRDATKPPGRETRAGRPTRGAPCRDASSRPTNRSTRCVLRDGKELRRPARARGEIEDQIVGTWRQQLDTRRRNRTGSPSLERSARPVKREVEAARRSPVFHPRAPRRHPTGARRSERRDSPTRQSRPRSSTTRIRVLEGSRNPPHPVRARARQCARRDRQAARRSHPGARDGASPGAHVPIKARSDLPALAYLVKL